MPAVECPQCNDYVDEQGVCHTCQTQTVPPKKVGLSLSFCVLDMAKGNVDMNDVAFIYSGTRAETSEQWESVIDTYKRNYWGVFSKEAERIARHFISNNLVVQPRLEGKEPITLHSRPEEGLRFWIDLKEYSKLAE